MQKSILKLNPVLALFGAASLFFLGGGSVRAGTAIASDKHGGFAVRYGHFSQAELQGWAIAALKKVSKHPKSIYIYTYKPKHGYGCLVRYKVNGVSGITAAVGWPTAAGAANSALNSAKKIRGVNPVIVSKWLEE